MTRCLLSARWLVIALSMLCTSPSRGADDPAKGSPPSLNDLSLEVTALQTLHEFRFTPAQLESLRKLAKETAAEATPRDDIQASTDLRLTLHSLRDALIDGDDDRIEELQERLDELRD